VTPNKDIEGEEREELKKREANSHVIPSVEGLGVGLATWVYPVNITVHPHV